MCDVNDEKIAAEQIITNKKKFIAGSICMKCKIVKAIVVVRVHDPLCKSCFLKYITHKFRSTLGKSRLIKANDKVLLAVSGGDSSMAMLNLVKEALSENAHKRLNFSPAVIYIDESCIGGDNVGKNSCSNTLDKHLQKVADEFNYPFFNIPIYKDYASENDDTEETVSGNMRSFINSFNLISTLTAKTDFLNSLRMSQVVKFAKENNFSKVMFGENASRLAIKLLCHVAQGKGATISQDIGVADPRFDGLILIRPMREFGIKEVVVFNRLKNINVISIENLDTNINANSSLQRQTEEFIISLQADFPSTVSTVFRTGDKICSSIDTTGVVTKCLLCNSPDLQHDVLLAKNKCETTSDCCGKSEECSSGGFQMNSLDVINNLCYGCRLTFKDMNNSINVFPQLILDKCSLAIKRQKMKEVIQDFLIE